MYSDPDTPAYGTLGGAFGRRSSHSDAAPWSHGSKVLLWIGLVLASWAAVILPAYFVWSTL